MKKAVFIAVAAIFTLCIYSFSPKKGGDKKHEKERYPKDYAPDQTVLLVQHTIIDSAGKLVPANPVYSASDYSKDAFEKVDKRLKESLDEHYKQKYELASVPEIIDSTGKYADRKLYRFALLPEDLPASGPKNTYTSSGQWKTTYDQTIYRFYLYDRLENKSYAVLGNGSTIFSWAFKQALKRITK